MNGGQKIQPWHSSTRSMAGTSSIASKFPWAVVDTDAACALALEDLRRFQEIAFACEGFRSRTDALSVLCLLGLNMETDGDPYSCAAVAYVVDLHALGPATFSSGLGDLLSNPDVRKVTFDCRASSDAIYHQFHVLLGNVWDCQVMEQAVRLANGEPLPKRTGSKKKPVIPLLKDIATLAQLYIPRGVASIRIREPIHICFTFVVITIRRAMHYWSNAH